MLTGDVLLAREGGHTRTHRGSGLSRLQGAQVYVYLLHHAVLGLLHLLHHLLDEAHIV